MKTKTGAVAIYQVKLVTLTETDKYGLSSFKRNLTLFNFRFEFNPSKPFKDFVSMLITCLLGSIRSPYFASKMSEIALLFMKGVDV